MRVCFKKGKQRELLNHFKNENSFSWNDLSKYLNIKRGRLNEYIYENVLLPYDLYNLIDKKGFFKKYITEFKESNWGQKKGGKISLGKTKKINLPCESVELAEFYGAMLGDGNSCRIKAYKKGTYMVRIVGDIKLDESYHLLYLKPLMERLFKTNVYVGRFKSNARYLEIHSKKLVDFLEEKGFIPGNKIKNNLLIPKWIKDNRSFLTAFLRGLYDTDGSFYKLTNQNSFQICLTSANNLLLEDVRSCLSSLGIISSKVSKKDLYITKKSELRKFFKLIGFKNPRHLDKVKVYLAL